MPVVAIPNISEGRDHARISALVSSVTSSGTRVLDVHSDETHNRTVITAAAPTTDDLVDAMVSLADACRDIDLPSHSGVHPRLGGLDVCPFVPHNETMVAAVAAARTTAGRIGDEVSLPVYLYGAAARRPETRELPALREGGLAGLIRKAERGLVPDAGPRNIDPDSGVVCVGARQALVAFNVWLACGADAAREIATIARIPTAIRALGLRIGENRAQVSMNLVEPERVGIDAAFDMVAREARARGIEVLCTEIVGLPPSRFMPEATKEAARLLIQPGRSLDSALEAEL